MKKNITYKEKDMVIEFCKKLKSQNIKFAVEVPFFNRSIDLVYYENNSVCILEFKLYDWKSAVMQAKVCLNSAHYVYICIPKTIYKKNIKSFAKNNDCGLMLFDMETKKIEIAYHKKNNEVWNELYTTLENGVEYAITNNNYELLERL